jgi:hypothetical protein
VSCHHATTMTQPGATPSSSHRPLRTAPRDGNPHQTRYPDP